jgi:hypothetical protein
MRYKSVGTAMKLKNTFNWSHSRRKNFERCKRLYYLNHYAFWGGWEDDADELARLCYRLSKIQNLEMWGGQIVHDEIETILDEIRRGLRPEFSAIEKRAVNSLRSGWVNSRNKMWRQSPKWNLNLFEHYYRIDIPREKTDAVKANVLGCLERFLHSGDLAGIRETPSQDWRTLEQFQQFKVAGFGVIVKMDFALEQGNNVIIYDWKTGKPWKDDLDQLECYALYAYEKWNYPADQIKVRPFYLRESSSEEMSCTEEALEVRRQRITEECKEMESYLVDPGDNLARIDDFPMVDDRRTCQRCAFYEACYNTRRIEGL